MRNSCFMTPVRWIALSWLLLITTGCGYSMAGKAVRIPASVQTIAIPGFGNQTQSYRLEQVITAAVVKEFVGRTRFHVINQASADADATLHGTVVSAQVAPLTYDSQTGRASSALVTVHLRVSLVDKNGKVLFENPDYIFREEYQVSREISSFFEEESPAIERLSRDLAQTLVADVLEAY